jgi:diacylglycerol kinase family enzyme
MIQRPFFIVNPRSAGGETGKIWDVSLRRMITERFPTARWAFTAAQGQGSRLAMQAWQEGADMVVAVGGDGTVNEVVNGLLENPLGDLDQGLPGSQGATWPTPSTRGPRPILAHLPRGTGCDFAKSIGIPKDIVKGLDAIRDGRTVASDVGRIELTARKGGSLVRYFINISGIGASGEVVERVNKSGKQLGGFLSFFAASLATTVKYYSPEIEITVDHGVTRTLPLNVIFICNAQYCGGGMWVGRHARLNDNTFHVVEVASTNRVNALLNGGKLYTGKMESVPGANLYPARSLKLESKEEVLVECDGEQPGILPATYSLLNASLQLRVGAKALAVDG